MVPAGTACPVKVIRFTVDKDTFHLDQGQGAPSEYQSLWCQYVRCGRIQHHLL